MMKLWNKLFNQITIISTIYFTGSWAAHMRITHEGASVRSFNEKYVEGVKFFVDRINATMVTLNYNLNTKMDLPDTHMYIKYDGWINDSWVPVDVVNFDAPFCDLVTDGDLNAFKPCMTDGVRGNFPEECDNDGSTLPKRDYFISKCYLDESIKLDSFLPGRWRVNIDFFTGDGQDICHLYWIMNCIEIP